MGRPAYPAVNWQTAGTTSQMVKCDGNQLIGFITGATLVSTTMTFSMVQSAVLAQTASNFLPVKGSAGTAISFTVAPNGYYGFSADQVNIFTGVEIFKFVGGSSEAAGTSIEAVFIPRQY